MSDVLRWIRRNPPAILFVALCAAWMTYIVVLVVRNARAKPE